MTAAMEKADQKNTMSEEVMEDLLADAKSRYSWIK